MSGSTLRLGFAGTPSFAATILATLLTAKQNLGVVYTQPDRRSGRGRRLIMSPVKQLAEDHGLPIAQPPSLRAADAQSDLADHHLDLLIVAAYGLILPEAILQTPRLGCINVHASLLPRWRGAAPVERAIMAGDHETGVSIMQMDAGLDTGPVYATRHYPISNTAEGPELEAKLAQIGGALLLDCLDDIERRAPLPQPQEGACYAAKLTKADAKVDWNQDALIIDRQIRALCGRLPATVTRGDLRIKLLRATPRTDSFERSPGTIVRSGRDGIVVVCHPGSLVLQQVQLSVGQGKPLDALAACNGYPDIFAQGASLLGDE